MPAEADWCNQAGVSGPTKKAWKKLSCWEAESEGHQGLLDLNTEPVLPRFPSAGSSNHCGDTNVRWKRNPHSYRDSL